MLKLHRKYVARNIAILVLIGGAVGTMATRASAAVNADVRGAVIMDQNEVGVGAGVITPFTDDRRWYFNPNLELSTGNSRSQVSMNGDVHYDISQRQTMSVWMGAGPAVLVRNPEVGDTHTSMGVNLLTGVGGTKGNVRPFGQLKGVVSDNSEVVLQGGIRF